MLRLIRHKKQDVTDVAAQEIAKIIECYRADRLVVPQPIHRRAADTVLMNQNICADLFAAQRIPKWFKRYHTASCVSLRNFTIISIIGNNALDYSR